jgi:hypothetical protein
MPLDKVLSKAAEETTKLLEAERAKGKTEAEQKKAEAAGTEGIGAATVSTPTEKKVKVQTEQEYVDERKERLLKSQGY